MQSGEMRDAAKRRLFSYREDSAAVIEWEKATSELAGKSDNMGIRGSKTSDPTADVAARRIAPPENIKEKIAWVEAINDAWADLQHEDDCKGIKENGKAYVMERYYGLTKRNPAKYAQKVEELCEECCVCEGTLKNWLRDCIEAVALHAATKQLA